MCTSQQNDWTQMFLPWQVALCYQTLARNREVGSNERSVHVLHIVGGKSCTCMILQMILGIRYRWIVRSRWDIGFVSPLPPLIK
jgi:hypothetical protein